MFSADGSLLHTGSKSQLMSILESNATESRENVNEDINSYKVAVVDAMNEVQSMGKPHWIMSCSDLADHFVEVVNRKYIKQNVFREVHFVFDRYDEASVSLKSDTRRKRQGTRAVVQYKISESTNISNVSLTKLLSHCTTKDELSAFLSRKVLQWAADTGESTNIVCSWQYNAESHMTDVSHLSSSHEEADTKIVLHAVDAAKEELPRFPSIHRTQTCSFFLSEDFQSFLSTHCFARELVYIDVK